MKVYVCYDWVQYEGCSVPLKVFSNEEDAAKWAAEQSNDCWGKPSYKEMDVE